jgi:hypothetical protein
VGLQSTGAGAAGVKPCDITSWVDRTRVSDMLNEELPAKHCVAKEEHVNRDILRDALLLFVVLVVGFFMGATSTRMQAGGPGHGASWQTSGNLWPWSEDQTVEDAPCGSSGLAPIPALLRRSWICDELPPAETACVAEFVIRHMKINAAMAGGDATGNCFSGTEAVTLIPPPKVHARAFVDGLVDEPPARYAKVVVVRGLQDLPDVMEYRVGPISGCNVGKCNEPKIDGRAPCSHHPAHEARRYPVRQAPLRHERRHGAPLTFVAIKELMPVLSTEICKIWDWIPGCAPGECYDPAQCRSSSSRIMISPPHHHPASQSTPSTGTTLVIKCRCNGCTSSRSSCASTKPALIQPIGSYIRLHLLRRAAVPNGKIFTGRMASGEIAQLLRQDYH